jgi:D-glucosaminate-6-phosphate ammonia-lyase
VLRQAPKGVTTKTPALPVADIAGRWDVEMKYSRGTARHSLLLVTNGNHVEGSHIGTRLHGAVRGDVDGDRVRLRSSLPHEGTRLNYRFEGRVEGQTIEGEVDLGEYGTAHWAARRQDARQA